MPQSLEKTKNLGIRATEARRKDLRRLSADKGLSVQALVDHAINQVYFSGGEQSFPDANRVSSPFGDLTKEEHRLLAGLLAWWRGTKEEELKPLLTGLAKGWLVKKQSS